MGNIAGIILAAGYSSRMNALKALYPAGNMTVLERAFRTLESGGIGDIYVVTGYKKSLIEQFLKRLKTHTSSVKTVYNPDYDRGMFSSVLAGLSALPPETDGFMLLPVDSPFVRPSTVRLLKDTFESTDADIISPLFEGEPGHPPVVGRSVFSSILNGSGGGGLRAVLADDSFLTSAVETGDPGILDDIDDDTAYCRFIKKYDNDLLSYPSRNEIEEILRELGISPGLAAHMDKVDEIAAEFCERLNAAGAMLNPGLLAASCRLHDICKGEPDHAGAAARKLTAMGYSDAAGIVAVHMEIDVAADGPVTEAELLYLADKMTEGSLIPGLEARMNARLEQYADNPDAVRNIRARFEKAFLIEEKLKRLIYSE